MFILVSLCSFCPRMVCHYETSFTSDGDGQGLAFSRNKGASTQLDPIQAVVVALVGALGAGESESDGRGEGR